MLISISELICFSLVFSSFSESKIFLNQPIVGSESNKLTLSVEMSNFSLELLSPVVRGGKVYFEMEVDMFKVVNFPLVPDEKVMSGKIVREVSYDLIHNEFKVKEELKKNDFVVNVSFYSFPNIESLIHFLVLWKFVSKSISELEKGEEYYFEARVLVYAYRLYPPLNLVVELFGGGEVKTERVKSSKIAIPSQFE